MRAEARFGLALTVALLIGAAALAIFWPGVAMYDSVAQFGQVVSGEYTDWHPPIMARLWAVLLGAAGGGTAPMLVLQLALYAMGFGLIAGTLAATGRSGGAIVTLVLAGSPLLLGWQSVVLKDAQMLGATVAAVGIVAAFRLRCARVPVWALALVGILLGYALLVRSNALFAILPLIVFLAPIPWTVPGKLVAMALGAASVLAVTPSINHRLFRAEATDIAKSQPLFDLAGIAVRVPDADVGFTPAERAMIVARRCSKPFFWDPLGDEAACGGVVGRLHEEPAGALYRRLAAAAFAHPLAYAAQRTAHWNSTERWLVSPGLIGAAPPAVSEPNNAGLISPPSSLAAAWQRLAAVEGGTPLGWPILWTVLALMAATLAWPRRKQPVGNLALALAFSALGMEASFLVVSIASDLRYHLWSMTASALALLLLLDGTRPPRRVLLLFGTIALSVIVTGLVARATLPLAPASYRAMIEA